MLQRFLKEKYLSVRKHENNKCKTKSQPLVITTIHKKIKFKIYFKCLLSFSFKFQLFPITHYSF